MNTIQLDRGIISGYHEGQKKWIHSKPIIVRDLSMERGWVDPAFASHILEMYDYLKNPICFFDIVHEMNPRPNDSFDLTYTVSSPAPSYRECPIGGRYGFSMRTTALYNPISCQSEVFMSVCVLKRNLKK